MKLLTLTFALLAALCGVEGQGDGGAGSSGGGDTMFIDCDGGVEKECDWVSPTMNVDESMDCGADEMARYIPADTAGLACECAKWACVKATGCEDADCPEAKMPDCEGENMHSTYVKPDPAKGKCCGHWTECMMDGGDMMTSVVYKTDPWDRVYQWSHYYSETTGEPMDSRVPPNWGWKKHAMGAKNWGCEAKWNKATQKPDLLAPMNAAIMDLNICGADSGACCIRGWKAAIMFCQEFTWCTVVDFMDEDPSDYAVGLEEDHDDTERHFKQMVMNDGDAEFADKSSYGFYDAITDPIYVLRGGYITENDDKWDESNMAKYWNSCESPLKCPDGTLKDCKGRCYGAPKEAKWTIAAGAVNGLWADIHYDAQDDYKITWISEDAKKAGVWPSTSMQHCRLHQAGDWWVKKESDGDGGWMWSVKNPKKWAKLMKDDPNPSMPHSPYVEADFRQWWESATEMDYDVTVHCTYSPYGNCKVYGLDWGHYPVGDCRALWGDYVCDKGQRILSSGELGPDLNCHKFEGDNGDCQCEQGRTMTCSGYCLSDDDCASDVWGKTKCSDWLEDDICDYGQRISKAQITMHFECAEWEFDNGACGQDGDFTCPTEPLDEADIDASCPADSSTQGSRTWEAKVMAPAPEPTVHMNFKWRNNADIYKISGDVESIKAEIAHISEGLGSGPRYVTPDGETQRTPPEIHDQDRVWVSYFHSGYFYEAVINDHNGKNGIEVTYNDGDRQEDVEVDEVMAQEDWADGAKVWHRTDHGDWELGMVKSSAESDKGTEYELEFGNGDKITEWQDWETLRPEYTFVLGDHVWAERDGNLRWFKGVIVNAWAQGEGDWSRMQYDVKYTNGEVDKGVISPYVYLIHPKRIIQTGAGEVDEAGVCAIVNGGTC